MAEQKKTWFSFLRKKKIEPEPIVDNNLETNINNVAENAFNAGEEQAEHDIQVDVLHEAYHADAVKIEAEEDIEPILLESTENLDINLIENTNSNEIFAVENSIVEQEVVSNTTSEIFSEDEITTAEHDLVEEQTIENYVAEYSNIDDPMVEDDIVAHDISAIEHNIADSKLIESDVTELIVTHDSVSAAEIKIIEHFDVEEMSQDGEFTQTPSEAELDPEISSILSDNDTFQNQSEPEPVEIKKEAKEGFFSRLKNRLSKTRHSLTDGIADLILGKKQIDDEVLDELEMRLLTADVGIEATTKIIKKLTEQVSRKSLKDVNALFDALRIEMLQILSPVEKNLIIDQHSHKPYVILMIGVNGVGKTTTIGKLAKKLQAEGKSVMLAAGDTFRAAAVEQLKVWGERNNIPVIAQKEGADTASVIFDALESAIAKKVDVLIADTAGRLHTQTGLMNELGKVHRVIKKIDPTAPHEVMLVIDASTGQNGLNQAQQFNQTIPLTGLTLTKLDGTAKGGIVFAIAEKMGLPVRFIGVGESIDDLRPFEAKPFIDALIGDPNIPIQ